MSRSDQPSGRTARKRPSTDVRVRHFDELTERAQQALVDGSAGLPGKGVAPGFGGERYATVGADALPGVDDGDVVVFTSYYRAVSR